MRGTRSASGTSGSIAAQRSPRGQVEQVAAVEVQHVEEERRERHRARSAATSAAGRRGSRCPGTARGRPSGRSAIASPSRISVRAGSARAASTTSGTRVGDVVERAREHGDVVAVAVHLHAHAVELPLDRGRRRSAPARPRRRRGRGEHRLHGAADLEPERAERRGALRQRRLGDAPEVAGSIAARRTAAGVDAGGRRDGVGDDARERALAQLARPAWPGSAARRRSRGRTARRRLRAARRLEPGPLSASIAREARDRPPRPRAAASAAGGGQVAQRRPADADAPLAQLAREVADDDRDLVRRCAAQAVGERRDLRQARARGGDGSRGGDEICEQHPRIVLRG